MTPSRPIWASFTETCRLVGLGTRKGRLLKRWAIETMADGQPRVRTYTKGANGNACGLMFRVDDVDARILEIAARGEML